MEARPFDIERCYPTLPLGGAPNRISPRRTFSPQAPRHGNGAGERRSCLSRLYHCPTAKINGAADACTSTYFRLEGLSKPTSFFLSEQILELATVPVSARSVMSAFDTTPKRLRRLHSVCRRFRTEVAESRRSDSHEDVSPTRFRGSAECSVSAEAATRAQPASGSPAPPLLLRPGPTTVTA